MLVHNSVASVILTQLSFFVNSQIVQNILHKFSLGGYSVWANRGRKNNEKNNKMV